MMSFKFKFFYLKIAFGPQAPTSAQVQNSTFLTRTHVISGLVQDCSNPIANAQELLQSFTKSSI